MAPSLVHVGALLTLGLTFASYANAILPDGRPHGNAMHIPAIPRIQNIPDAPVTDRNGTEIPPYDTTYYFDQLIDHNDPSKGTFKQRYWHTWEFYEPGGPIIFMTPGEGNAEGYDGYLTNRTINGLIAQQQNGAAIVFEHRFYGLSNPLPDLSVESLQLLNVQQALDDFEYFAENVVLPMPGGDAVTPGKAPWIFVGGSYSGQLASYVMVNKPGLFHASYSSSGVVQTIEYFWQYFEPIRQNMPANCSADVSAVVGYFDQVFRGGNAKAKSELKALFGLTNVTHDLDVLGTLRNNLWDWQSLQPTTGPGAQFFQFCDALEVKDGVSAGKNGWGLKHALPAWGNYFKTQYYSKICGTLDAETCLGTYDGTQDFYTNESVDNSWRSWFWQVCNQEGFFQDGPPAYRRAIVSRLILPAYDLGQCSLMFPKAFPKAPASVDTASTNAKYLGWNVRLERLFFANGIRDPWREATISASGLNVPSTAEQPIALSDGFHCSDLSARSAAVDQTVAAVHVKALAAMKGWISEWEPVESSYRQTGKRRRAALYERQDVEVSSTGAKPINAWFRGAGTA